jgi:hypothetical protein
MSVLQESIWCVLSERSDAGIVRANGQQKGEIGMNILKRLFGAAIRKSCAHESLTSTIERVGKRYVHVQDACDCGWKSPRFEQPGEAIEFWRKRLEAPASE